MFIAIYRIYGKDKSFIIYWAFFTATMTASVLGKSIYNLDFKSLRPTVEVIYPAGLSTGIKTSLLSLHPPTALGNFDKSTLKKLN